MGKPDHIAICSYYFPPLNSVGGRRWVKFARYFQEKNIKCTFFTANSNEYPDRDKMFGWEHDLESIYKIIPVSSGYPVVINSGAQSFSEKINYRFQKFLLKLNVRGNIYDPTVFWDKKFNSVIKPYLKENNINHLVISGAPFAYMHQSLQLKKDLPQLKLIADFRDLWVDSKLGYGEYVRAFQGENRFNTELSRQKEVLENFDKIVVVSEDFKNIYLKKYNVPAEKVEVISNGFDPEEGMVDPVDKITSNDKIRFLYFGTINCGKEYYELFLEALRMIKSKNNELFKKLEFHFVGNNNQSFSESITRLEFDNIFQKPRMSLKDLIKYSSNFDYLLYFKLESDLKNSFGTKFFDYLRFCTPIVILSPSGAVTEYINDNSIGYILNEEDVYHSLIELMQKHLRGETSFQVNQLNDRFNIKRLSVDYIDLLSQI